MSSTCPFCGSETRPGDNFCLNCGNRLSSATPSPQQQQAVPVGDSTIPAQDGWGQQIPQQPAYQAPTIMPSPPLASWIDPAAPTITSNSSSQEPPTTFGANVVQTPSPTSEHSAKFILRADNGDVLQEYPLEKTEIAIGRAPNSDILLSKDKLTSRRHATVKYDNGTYILHDEHSANGTFVNGQQLDEASTHVLQDGDHIGIGEHELVFRSVATAPASGSSESMFADMPTVSVPYSPNVGQELTYRTREDDLVTAHTNDDFNTRTMDNNGSEVAEPVAEPLPVFEEEQAVAPPPAQNGTANNGAAAPPATPPPAQTPPPAAQSPAPPPPSAPAVQLANMPSATYTPPPSDTNVTFNRLTSIPQPVLPDIAPLLAALSTLDGQVMTLQAQLNATQEAVRNHETEVVQTSNQLRSGVRRVSERMDDTIADVARSREALAWAELLQLMEDVMNNPRDIEYVTKLARKARELNKVFQLHQSVLNTLAECNSLLRSLVGDERQQ